MILKEVHQDLFTVPKDYRLVHCISADFALGAGIAKEFNKRFDMKRKLQSKVSANQSPNTQKRSRVIFNPAPNNYKQLQPTTSTSNSKQLQFLNLRESSLAIIRQRITPRQQRNKRLLGRIFSQCRQSSQKIQQITVNIKPVSFCSFDYGHSSGTCFCSLRSLFYHVFNSVASWGIGWRIQSKYPDYFDTFVRHRLGGDCIYEGRVLNLITKERYFEKPSIITMRIALQNMKEICLANDITKLAMPRIGCGLDRLQWDKVKQSIENIFFDTDVEILVCSL